MSRTVRILSAAAISLAAFHANAQVNGEDASYPMGQRGAAASSPASGAAAAMTSSAQPYVWTGNEVGLVHSQSAPAASSTAQSDMRAPANRAMERTQGSSDRMMPIFLGA